MSGGSFFGYITIVTCAGHFIRSHRGQVQLPPIKLGVNATFSLIHFLLMCSLSYTDFLQIHNLLRRTFVTPTNKAVKSQPAWSGNRANITQSKDSLLFITKKIFTQHLIELDCIYTPYARKRRHVWFFFKKLINNVIYIWCNNQLPLQ